MNQPLHTSYSVKEEIAHTVTHGFGTLLSIVGLLILLSFSRQNDDIWYLISCSIYGSSLILLYGASTLYHHTTHTTRKAFLQRIDHAAIYLLIAGTYTPFLLISLRESWGWHLFIVIWTLALIGVTLEFINWKPFQKVSLALYLGMGWIILFAINPMLEHVETGGLILLLIGGLFYSFGVIFYVWEKLTFNHAIWHLFVLAGSAAHFFSIFIYVIY